MSKIAVLMSSYNGIQYIKEQIESIIAQEGDFDIYLIVRDDGSEDGTRELLQEYQNAGILKWYTGENMGPARSFYSMIQDNLGYDYYAFADQDDVWDANKLSAAIKSIEEEKANENIPIMYFSNAELVDDKLKSLGRTVYNRFLEVNIETLSARGGVLGCTIVFNNALAQIIQNVEGIPGSMIMHDCYLAQVCVAVAGRIIADDKSHMKYRQHGNNVVGVSTSIVDKIFDRMKYSFIKRQVSIAEQSMDILDRFGKCIPPSNLDTLNEFANYRTSKRLRIKLAFSTKLKYSSWSIGLRNRLSILLGNL